MEQTRQQNIHRLAVCILFFVSGCCGLIYEVLWSKQLGLVFGNTVQSLSAVLTAFMSGLALGSYLAGRYCERLQRPLFVYGVLELLIGVYCAFLPLILGQKGPIVPIYRALYSEEGGVMLSAARFGITFLILLVPATFMGATLPVLSQFLVRSVRTMGRTVGMLYAINTLGAVAGAAATGFFLLPLLGKSNTNWVAVSGNVLLGLIGIVLGRRTASAETRREKQTSNPQLDAQESVPITARAVQATVLSFGVTGFAAMAMQIGWTRAISLATGSSTYAFSLIVSIFILGLALGGAWGARMASRTLDPVALLGKIQIWIGVLGLAVAALLGYGPIFFFFLVAWGSQCEWGTLLAIEGAGIAALIIVPTFLMGATMPLTLQIASRYSKNAGSTVGNVYSVNTAGSILGSLLGGLALLPLLTIRTTLDAMSLCYALPGLFIFLLSASRKLPRQIFYAVIPVCLLALLANFAPEWDPAILSSGMYLLRDGARVQAARDLRLKDALPRPPDDQKILFYKEGAAATVAVQGASGYMSISVGGKPEASDYVDLGTQTMCAMLPNLLHDGDPKDVLLIGLGSGISAGCAVASETVKQVDIVEMSPDVVRASWFFRNTSGLTYTEPDHWLNTPRLNLILNDGRNHLLFTQKTYDVIASEPSNPWMAGIGNLFTRENFELCRARLKSDGIMCQWVQRYSLEEADFYSIARTFSEVFPYVSLWNVDQNDFMLIGANHPLKVRPQAMERYISERGVKETLQRVRMDRISEVLGCFVADNAELRKVMVNSPIFTDDNMALEFSSPRALYNPRQLFRSVHFFAVPDTILDLAAPPATDGGSLLSDLDFAAAAHEHIRYVKEEAVPEPEHTRAALALDPYQKMAIDIKNRLDEQFAVNLLNGVPTARKPPDVVSALTILENTRIRSERLRYPEANLDVALAQRAEQLATAGDTDGALKLAGRITHQPEQLALLRAKIFILKKDYDSAMNEVKKASELGADAWACANFAITIFSAQKRFDAVSETIDKMLAQPSASTDKAAAPLWFSKAAFLRDRGNLDEAAAACDKALQLIPAFMDCMKLRSEIAQKQGKWRDSIMLLRQRAALEPLDMDARLQVAEAVLGAARNSMTQKNEDAVELFRFARRTSREVCSGTPKKPGGWIALCRSFIGLAECDSALAAVYRDEADKCLKTALTHVNGDASKLPEDLREYFKIPAAPAAANLERKLFGAEK